MPDKPQLYKLLNPDGTTPQTGYQWPEPGVWLPAVKGELVACENGYHVVTLTQALDWSGHELWTVETKGRVIDSGDKHVARRVRRLEHVPGWNERNLRLFACDCVERALARVEKPDPRSVNAIVVARKFANGDATSEELAAARDAAMDAARDAAWDDGTAGAVKAASWAAWDDGAARAARAAAWAAAWAAREDEREWQANRLRDYVLGNIQEPQ